MKTWCPVPPPQKDGQDIFWVMGDLFDWVLNRGVTEKQLGGGTPLFALKK